MAKSKPDSASSSAKTATKLDVLETFDLNDVVITGFETTYSEAVKPNVKNGARVDFGSKTYANTIKVGFRKPILMNVGNASQVKKVIELNQFLAMKTCRDAQERDGVIPNIADDVYNIRNMADFPHVNKANVVKAGEELPWILERFEELGAELPVELKPKDPVEESAPVVDDAPAPPAAEVRRPSIPTAEA